MLQDMTVTVHQEVFDGQGLMVKCYRPDFVFILKTKQSKNHLTFVLLSSLV